MKNSLLFLTFLMLCTSNAHAGSNAELRIGIDQEFENLNPVIHQMSATSYIMYAVQHPLVSMTPDGKWQCWLCVEFPTLENGLAKIIDEGGKKKIVVNWEIKPNAKWADGAPVTGNDVKLGWEIGSSPNVSVGEKEVFTYIEDIKIDPQNPKKFVMKYNVAHYDFAYLGTFYLLPDHIERVVWEKTKNVVGDYEKQTKYATDSTNPGLYDGPYRVTEIVLGSHVIAEPNPGFYGDKPKIQKLIFKLIPDSATMEANLVSGTIDMICEIGIKFDQALAMDKRFKADLSLGQKYKVVFQDGVIYEHIDLQFKNPILKDLNVRQALMYALDRDKLVQALFEGRQKKAIHNIDPRDPYYTEDVPQYSYDPQKAETLLDAAGWKKGPDGLRYKDGQKLSLMIMSTAQDKTRELVEVYLQQLWKKVGIELTIKNEPARVYFGETVRKGLYPAMAMFAWTSNPDNPPRAQLTSSQIPTEKNGYSGQNSGGWSNAVADKNLDAVYDEFDINKRKEMMKTSLQEYTRDVPVIPLYYRAEIVVVPTNLKGYVVTGHQFYSTLGAEHWEFQ